MKKPLLRRAALLCSVALALLLAAVSSSVPTNVRAQSNQLTAEGSTLHRFRVSSSNGGYMLTGIPQRGYNLGYTDQGSIFPPITQGGTTLTAGIVLPPDEQYCYSIGGWWDSSDCLCNYWNTDQARSK